MQREGKMDSKEDMILYYACHSRLPFDGVSLRNIASCNWRGNECSATLLPARLFTQKY